MSTKGEKLLADMKSTAGTRFIAAERLRSKDKLENLIVAFFSAAVLIASLVPILFDLRSQTLLSTLLSLLVVASSVLILVLSMRIYAEKTAVEAEELKRSALEISALRRLAVAANLDDNRSYRSYAERYSEILNKFSVNHSERDFLAYKRKHSWEFEDESSRAGFRLPQIENLFEKLGLALGTAAAGASLASLLSLLGI